MGRKDDSEGYTIIPPPGAKALEVYQEWQPGERCPTGRDPAEMSKTELQAAGHTPRPLLAVIRDVCIDLPNGHRVIAAASNDWHAVDATLAALRRAMREGEAP
jgi:hypothetical protein